jgi:Universal stress protein family
LIILGSHGRGPVGRLLLGSVSQYVVGLATVPVVVVRKDLDKTLLLPAERWVLIGPVCQTSLPGRHLARP